MRLDARWLFQPLRPAELLERYLEKEICHLDGRGKDFYAPLFSRQRLAEMLWEQEGQAAELVYAYVEGHTQYLPQPFAATPWEWVRAQYRQGWPIVVNSISRFCAPVAALCRDLASVIGAPVHANAYFAPPSAPGFGAHFDTDDTIFLQIEGSKHWHLYPPVVELPLLSQLVGIDPRGLGPDREIELGPGDLLYLPRGVIHTPVAGPAGSLHLTLGLHHRLRRDALVDALAVAAERHPALHERARPGDAKALGRMLDLFLGNALEPGAERRASDHFTRRERQKPAPDELL
jgi:ribosomal protein L16 Arg81 hydroxylase